MFKKTIDQLTQRALFLAILVAVATTTPLTAYGDDPITSCDQLGYPPTQITAEGEGTGDWGNGVLDPHDDLIQAACLIVFTEGGYEKLEDQASSEALQECSSDLQSQIAEKLTECTLICQGNGEIKCGKVFKMSEYDGCDSKCEWGFLGPFANTCGIPNYVECNADGAVTVECTCKEISGPEGL